MSSSETTAQEASQIGPTNPLNPIVNENQAVEEIVEAAEFDDSDSALGCSNSETTSIASSIYAGYVENGRRYQTLRDGEYFGPADEKQFEAQNTLHLAHLILDCKASNSLFRSPISQNAQNILDIGTGSGVWAIEVADRYPSALVRGVDLYPPPQTWLPPNCKFEVDDVLKPWTWQTKFDLIHMRTMAGSFTEKQWQLFYTQVYNNLQPGGYIEQVEMSVYHLCDDGTFPPNSDLASWGQIFLKCAEKAGKPLDTVDTMKRRIQAAGFTNIQEKTYKMPLGRWAKNPVLREAGKFNRTHLLEGMEGYAMYLLTKFGDPQPWSAEEVQLYLAKVRDGINNNRWHPYSIVRRVWAQRPLDDA